MATALSFDLNRLTLAAPLPLDSGRVLEGVELAYETYGTLAADKGNAILIFHALTGDQFVAKPHPVTGKPGWWERMVGPGKPIDTSRYFVVCANIVGGCMGSTGPASPAPDGQQRQSQRGAKTGGRAHQAFFPSRIHTVACSITRMPATKYRRSRRSSTPRMMDW